jgi:hypothetical protein
MAEVVMPATVPVARNIVGSSADCSFGTINWHLVVKRLMVTWEESVATPMVMPLVCWRGNTMAGSSDNRIAVDAGNVCVIDARYAVCE